MMRSLYIFLLILSVSAFLSCASHKNDNTPPAIDRLLTNEEAFEDLKSIGLYETASFWKEYLDQTGYFDRDSLMGSTVEEKEKSRQFLLKNYGRQLAANGISESVMREHASSDQQIHAVINAKLGGHMISDDTKMFEIDFALAEIVVQATIDRPVKNLPETYLGPAAYYLDIQTVLKGSLPVEPISVRQDTSSEARRYEVGMECVLFLSPTYTKYARHAEGRYYQASYPHINQLPTSLLQGKDICRRDGDKHFETYIFGSGNYSVTREQIMRISRQAH